MISASEIASSLLPIIVLLAFGVLSVFFYRYRHRHVVAFCGSIGCCVIFITAALVSEELRRPSILFSVFSLIFALKFRKELRSSSSV